MIYNEKPKLKFDDSIIRGVDSIINSTYYADNSHCNLMINSTQYLYEFRTVFLKLPRQCGKTTYLKKLYQHLQKLGQNPLVVTTNWRMGRDQYHCFEKITKEYIFESGLREPIYALTEYKSFDVILLDEIAYQKGIETDIKELFPSTKLIVGLYT